MNLVEVLAEQARRNPDAAAIIAPGASLTFAGLERATTSGAARLRAAGLVPGDAVLVFVPMGARLYEVLLAVMRAGLTAVFLDPSASRAQMARCCALMPPRAFIGIPRAHLLRWLTPALRRIPLAWSVDGWFPGARRWAAVEGDGSIAAVTADTPALVTFTSGSTDQPKAAVRSHGFLLAQHRVLADTLHHVPGIVDLATLPIFALANLASGQTTLIPDADLRRPGAVDATPVLRQIAEHRPATVVASPAFCARLADACEQEGRTLDSLTALYTGGAPVFPALLDRLAALAPQARVVAVYGSTEAEPIAEIARSDMTATDLAAMRAGRGLLAGPPVPQIACRVIADHWGTPMGPFTTDTFAALRCAVDEPGEIVVSGAHVLPGYLHGQGDGETKFRVDGTVWHRTGDRGCIDAAGRLWLLGRCSATVHDIHGSLHPFAVECAAMQVPGVVRAALAPMTGRRLLAVEGSADAAAVRTALAWAQLDEVRLVARIPLDRRHNAKVDYPALLRLLKC